MLRASALAVGAMLVLWGMRPSCHAQERDPQRPCGEPVTIATHANTTTRYALAHPAPDAMSQPPVAVVLLPGGGGHLDLDPNGCPRALVGNFLVRALPLLHAQGFVTALVDTPSDHPGEEGLGGFRAGAQHADDLGKVIADLRARTGAAVWIIGTSRGTISASNAASRLTGAAAPDGLVLTSAITVGSSSRQFPWTRQTVFDFALDAIRMPTLIVGHAADACLRTPASQMDAIARRIGAARKQAVTVTGGPGGAVAASIDACAGRTPHGFLEQEVEVIAGIGRFIRGEHY